MQIKDLIKTHPHTGKTERLHALDALRAIIMLLGLVLHSAITYVTFDNRSVWGIQDNNSSHLFFDWLTYYIHSFRMPIFFVVAGFFTALLFYERSLWSMLENRLHRIVYPFIVFVILLWPCVNFIFFFTGTIINGTNNSLSDALIKLLQIGFIPSRTMHLWFLYYLVFYSIFGCLFGIIIKKMNLSSIIQYGYKLLMMSPFLRPIWFACPTFIFLFFAEVTWVEKTGSFIPNWKPISFYFTFYLFGWLMYLSKIHLKRLTQHAGWLVFFATTLFNIKFYYRDLLSVIVIMFCNSLIAWLFIFGIIGVFIHYFSHHSTKMRIISDASYWFYLIHLPLTCLVPGLLMPFDLPSWLKFTLVLCSTSFICWLSYLYCVRSTFIGQFLNGKISS